jgi:hypothetical protein
MCSIKIAFLILFISISSALAAQELVVTYGNRSYKLNNSKDQITFISQDIDLSLSRKKCNTRLMDRFSNFFKIMVSKPFIKTPRPGFIGISLDGVKGFEPKLSERGVQLSNMYETFKKFKIEDNLSCP